MEAERWEVFIGAFARYRGKLLQGNLGPSATCPRNFLGHKASWGLVRIKGISLYSSCRYVRIVFPSSPLGPSQKEQCR